MVDTRPGAAAVSILLAMALIGLIDNFMIYISASGSLWMFHAVRSAMALPMILGVALLMGWSVRPARWSAVVFRSFFAATAMILYFGALALLPITQAVAGLFTSPLFVLVISTLWLGEPAGRIRLVAAPLGFVGVLVVLQPWSGEASPLAPFAMVSGLFYAIAMIATRRSCAGETTMTLLTMLFVATGLWGAFGAVALTLLGPDAPAGAAGFVLRGIALADSSFYFWTFIQAVGSLTAVALITRSYQLADASFVAVFEYTVLVFAAAWAFVLTGTTPDMAEILGILLILIAGVLLASGRKLRAAA